MKSFKDLLTSKLAMINTAVTQDNQIYDSDKICLKGLLKTLGQANTHAELITMLNRAEEAPNKRGVRLFMESYSHAPQVTFMLAALMSDPELQIASECKAEPIQNACQHR